MRTRKELEAIFRKRLERIREDLNVYINIHFQNTEIQKESTPSVDVMQEKKMGIAEKFLSYMQLNDGDDFLEDDGDYEADTCQTASKLSSPSGAMKPGIALAPSENVPQSKQPDKHEKKRRVPEFLVRMPKQRNDIARFLERKEESFSAMLLRLIDEKELKDSEVYKSANIDRRLFSKIRGDEDYVPSKKTAISFCLALGLEMSEAKKLLETAGYTLSTSSRFDLIIMYLIENGEYNVHFANIVLEDYGEGTLSR